MTDWKRFLTQPGWPKRQTFWSVFAPTLASWSFERGLISFAASSFCFLGQPNSGHGLPDSRQPGEAHFRALWTHQTTRSTPVSDSWVHLVVARRSLWSLVVTDSSRGTWYPTGMDLGSFPLPPRGSLQPFRSGQPCSVIAALDPSLVCPPNAPPGDLPRLMDTSAIFYPLLLPFR